MKIKMDIKDLKAKIENKIKESDFIIFKNSDSDFIANQYTKAIAKNLSVDIEYISSLDIFYTKDPFSILDTVLYIYKTEELLLETPGLETNHNLIIICDKISKQSNSWYNDYVISIPKLEDWQLKDYAYSLAEGINQEQLNWLVAACNNNVYRLALELDRLKIFSINERQALFNKFLEEGIYSDLSYNTVFNLSNAIIKRDYATVASIYKELENMDFNIIGFIQILYNNFRNICLVQLSKAPSPETTGLKPNQFWAIKHNIGFYTKIQLIKIMEMLTGIDKQLKIGAIDTNTLLDYVINYIMSV